MGLPPLIFTRRRESRRCRRRLIVINPEGQRLVIGGVRQLMMLTEPRPLSWVSLTFMGSRGLKAGLNLGAARSTCPSRPGATACH